MLLTDFKVILYIELAYCRTLKYCPVEHWNIANDGWILSIGLNVLFNLQQLKLIDSLTDRL